MDIHSLLRLARKRNASDLHLITNSPPLLRIDGALQRVDGYERLIPEDISEALFQLTSPDQRETFFHQMELDFAYFLSGVGRLRCNACQQQGSISLNIRLLSPTIPTVDQLELPAILKDLIMRPRGLIIVTGPTGSGKSTSLAAMIYHLNQHTHRYIITIEDPVEYVHPNVKAAVSQRELGVDTLSFAYALKHVLRQDPDVILVGEMRDLETAAAVLNVAETGHLVLSTGHAPSAHQSIERVVDLFPLEERSLAQARLASILVAVLCQVLVPRVGGGRVAAVEVMLGTTAVKNLIREGKIHLLPNVIRTQANLGMQTLDEGLVNLYLRGTIDWATVLAWCQDEDEVNKLVSGIKVK